MTASATGAATPFETFNAVTSLDTSEIMKKYGATLADVLEYEPGVAKRTFGPGTSRPIIRGFDGDRVLIMQDGIRTGDLSSQSGDHGVSIDPAGLQRVEVVKGPATLLYGSNAIGGVVNAISPQEAFRSTPFSGTLGGAELRRRQRERAGRVRRQRAARPGAVARLRRLDDAPDRRLRRSRRDNRELRHPPDDWRGRRVVGGEPRASSASALGSSATATGFRSRASSRATTSLQIDLKLERQQVRFDAGARNLGGAFDTRAGHRRLPGLPARRARDRGRRGGTRHAIHEPGLLAARRGGAAKSARLGGRFGVDFLTRDYEAIGEEALAPTTSQNAFAAFAYEELSVGKHRVLLGGRVEHTGYDATDIGTRSFTGASGSVGFHAALGANGAFVANLTGASRAPALEELFNFGPHPGNLAFEVGDPDLEMERTFGFDASLRSRAKRASGELNFFYYDISNFVFLDVTDEIEDGLRVSNYVQADSRFTGMEAAGHFGLGGRAMLNASVAFVSATLTATDEHLPRIPPFQGRVNVDLPLRQMTITPEVIFSAKQSDVFRDETPTDGWATFNIIATYQLYRGHQTHMLSITGYNLTNTEYRLHTSFIKDLAPEMGAGVKAAYSPQVLLIRSSCQPGAETTQFPHPTSPRRLNGCAC